MLDALGMRLFLISEHRRPQATFVWMLVLIGEEIRSPLCARPQELSTGSAPATEEGWTHDDWDCHARARSVSLGRRSSLIGAGTATLALAAVIAAFGPALAFMPMDTLRVLVGTLLLVCGLQWPRKASSRAAGYQALRDEAALYQAHRADAPAAGTAMSADGVHGFERFKALGRMA